MYRVESQSRCRVAIRSMTTIVGRSTSPRGHWPRRDPRRRRPSPRADAAAPNHRPCSGYRLGRHGVGSLHHHSGCHRRCRASRDRGHHSTSLGPHNRRYKSCKPREDDLADHGNHLKAQPTGPYPDKPSTLGKMLPTHHRFQYISTASAEYLRSAFLVAQRHVSQHSVVAKGFSASIPHPLFPPTVL